MTVAFGVFYFPTDFQLNGLWEPEERTSGPMAMTPVEAAVAAEEREFESIFFPEHTHIPTPRRTQWAGGPALPVEYWHTLDPFVALSAAAAVTRRIRLGTGIAIIPQRDPFSCAKHAASLDFISNGRALLGIGSGWNAEEMENHGSAFEKRWQITRERVLAMKEIWTKETAEYHGRFVDFGPVLAYPKPVQRGGPPVLLGANSPWAIRRVVEYADGWLPIFVPMLMEPDGLVDELRTAAERAGRRFESISLSCLALNSPGGAPPDDFLCKLIDLGFTRIILRVPSVGRDEGLQCLDQYAAIAARLR
jgi:probable F420-dependent oxidoreductase